VQTSLVATVVCPDEPGIVERLGRIVSSHHASWEESRMACLAGRFAGILRVSVPVEHAEELTRALAELEQPGMEIAVQVGDGEVDGEERRIATLETIGTDRPGIVYGIFRTLAAEHVDVQELHTEVISAPWSGEHLFRAEARVAVPQGIALDALRRDLEAIGADLHVDVQLAEAE
jgi:glycine cleavage system regulatory protein